MRYGVRVRRGSEGWHRAKQFRKNPDNPSGWQFWRDEWPTIKSAQLQVERYRSLGFMAHVFEIQEEEVFPNSTHYSKNFTREELNCRGPECRGKQPPIEVQENLVRLCHIGLEPLRREYGHPLGILSGYRCPIHNHNVGGVSNSQHLYGKAADPIVNPALRDTLDEAINDVPAFVHGGRGRYPNGGRHVDIGPERTW